MFHIVTSVIVFTNSSIHTLQSVTFLPVFLLLEFSSHDIMSESELEKAQLAPNERRMPSTGEAGGVMSQSELEKVQLAPNERRMSSTGEAGGVIGQTHAR